MPEDGALVGAAGHLHPGGLYTDLKLTRDGRTVPLFRSEAKYFEPAGAVSWDVAMTVTPPDWRAGVRKGDVVSVSGTYDTRRASWYESMAIMPAMYARGAAGPDPFTTDVDVPGEVTHGHLPENDNHGGGRFSGLPDPRKLLARPVRGGGGAVVISGFVYGQGDLSSTGRRGRPALVERGKRLTFVNRDARPKHERLPHDHRVQGPLQPRRRGSPTRWPTARWTSTRASSGFGPAGRRRRPNRDRWRTPRSLDPGTYTYFCRVHPFMRGAFEVQKGR